VESVWEEACDRARCGVVRELGVLMRASGVGMAVFCCGRDACLSGFHHWVSRVILLVCFCWGKRMWMLRFFPLHLSRREAFG